MHELVGFDAIAYRLQRGRFLHDTHPCPIQAARPVEGVDGVLPLPIEQRRIIQRLAHKSQCLALAGIGGRALQVPDARLELFRSVDRQRHLAAGCLVQQASHVSRQFPAEQCLIECVVRPIAERVRIKRCTAAIGRTCCGIARIDCALGSVVAARQRPHHTAATRNSGIRRASAQVIQSSDQHPVVGIFGLPQCLRRGVLAVDAELGQITLLSDYSGVVGQAGSGWRGAGQTVVGQPAHGHGGDRAADIEGLGHVLANACLHAGR